MPINQRLQTLRLGLAMSPELSTEAQAKVVFTADFITFLRKQLANQRLSSHTSVCHLINQLIVRLRTAKSADEEKEEKVSEGLSVRAANFFRVLAGQCPLFDATATPKAPHLLSVSFSCVSKTHHPIE